MSLCNYICCTDLYDDANADQDEVLLQTPRTGDRRASADSNISIENGASSGARNSISISASARNSTSQNVGDNSNNNEQNGSESNQKDGISISVNGVSNGVNGGTENQHV